MGFPRHLIFYFSRSSDPSKKHQFLFRDPLAIHPVVFLGGLVEVLWVAIRFKAVNDDEGFYWCLWKLDSSCLMSLDVTRTSKHVGRLKGGKNTTFLGMDLYISMVQGVYTEHYDMWWYGEWQSLVYWLGGKSAECWMLSDFLKCFPGIIVISLLL